MGLFNISSLGSKKRDKEGKSKCWHHPGREVDGACLEVSCAPQSTTSHSESIFPHNALLLVSSLSHLARGVYVGRSGLASLDFALLLMVLKIQKH